MARLCRRKPEGVIDASANSDADKAVDSGARTRAADESLPRAVSASWSTYSDEDPRTSSRSPTCCFIPRTWSGSATTPPILPRRSSTSVKGETLAVRPEGDALGLSVVRPARRNSRGTRDAGYCTGGRTRMALGVATLPAASSVSSRTSVVVEPCCSTTWISRRSRRVPGDGHRR